ncbi:glutamine synthetase [bacterium]|nr:glutamine synthetase [bacterium]
MLSKKSVEKILIEAKAKQIEFVNFQFSDIFGKVKNVRIPSERLKTALENGVWFDGSSIQGFTRIYESDALLIADKSTFIIDKEKKEASFICDVWIPTKNNTVIPFEGDPRFILKNQIRKAEELGYVYNVGPEIEFFVFKKTQEGDLIPQDEASYFDLSGDKGTEIRKEIVRAAKKAGIEVSAEHHEVANGQSEIDICYGPAIEIADKIIRLKTIIQEVVARFDCIATFMPKPMTGLNGSGMHIHQSIFDKQGNNLFYNKKDRYNLSDIAYQFMAGQIYHARSLSAIVAPTVNSYKRLVKGYEAPVYICWGQNNRSAFIRIPRFAPHRTNACRIELRCPDPSSNPYLAFAGMLAAGLDGIKNKIECPQPIEENVYLLNNSEYRQRNIKTLPTSLREAVNELEKDEVLMNALGSHLSREFIKAKIQECEEFRLEVTPLEIEKYL